MVVFAHVGGAAIAHPHMGVHFEVSEVAIQFGLAPHIIGVEECDIVSEGIAYTVLRAEARPRFSW